MQPADRVEFFTMLAGVYAFYRQELSDFVGSVWWKALQAYDLAAVEDAFGRHCANPDAGQYLPKPADVTKMLQGSTQDAALVAWAKVDHAVRVVGTYRTVVFDDSLIHRVVQDMGGWVRLGSHDGDEWPFVAKEFENRYRGYRIRSAAPDYPPSLVGIAEAQNSQHGFAAEPPMLIGNADQARLVLERGNQSALLPITQATALPAPGLGRAA